jgi:hypothetical protein
LDLNSSHSEVLNGNIVIHIAKKFMPKTVSYKFGKFLNEFFKMLPQVFALSLFCYLDHP